MEKREIHPDVARNKALKWLEIRLTAMGELEEFWDNYEEGLEEPPEKSAFLVLAPQVLAALKAGQALPAMDDDVRSAFEQYLEEYDDTIAASELANTDEEIRDQWTDAIMRAWVTLRLPLQQEPTHDQ